MATVVPTFTQVTSSLGVKLVTWPLTSTNTDGSPIELCQYADRCMTATGTWGGATLTIQGSNDGTNWVTLNIASSGAATATANAIMQLVELPRFIRPNLTTAGSGATVTVMLLARRDAPEKS